MATILTVDDSASIRQMVSFTLRGAGYEVLEAIDGKDALNKASVSPVSVVLTDLYMPNMDGITLIRELRKLPIYRFVPMLILTTEMSAGGPRVPIRSGVSQHGTVVCQDGLGQPQGAGPGAQA
jgi:two-component system, chemotaxis family, chemotaxis protein CheY